jgi:SAM-dependent methyltransferase
MDVDPFRAFEAAEWERQAGGYDELLGRVTSRLVDPLLDAADVGDADRVLDVATGPGYVAAAAAARGAQVVGFDVADAMIALARARHPGLDFRQADAESLPSADASFEAVVANFVVMHLGRPERAVAEFVRVLARGARVALTAWDVPQMARLLGVFVDALAAAGASTPTDIPRGRTSSASHTTASSPPCCAARGSEASPSRRSHSGTGSPPPTSSGTACSVGRCAWQP